MIATPGSVEIVERCEREQREIRRVLNLDEVPAYLENNAQRRAFVEKFVHAFQEGSKTAAFPDLVVYYKGQFVVYATVHPRKESRVLELLKTLTRSAVFGYKNQRGVRKKASNNGKRQYASIVLREGD